MAAFCAFEPGSSLEKVEDHLDERAASSSYARRASQHVHWAKSSADKAYQVRHDAVMVGVWKCPLADAYDADEKEFQSEYAMLCAFDALERPPPTTCDTPMTFRPTYGQDRVPADQFLAQVRHRSTSLGTRNLIDRTISTKPDQRQKVWDDAKPTIPTCFTNEDFTFDCQMSKTLSSTQAVPATPIYHRPGRAGGVGYGSGYGYRPKMYAPVE